MNYFELGANFFYLTSTFFASRNSVHTWWIGAASCVLFMITFFQVKLYADVTLQIFFIGTCLYGWINWKTGGKNKAPLPISKIKFSHLLFFILVSLFVTLIYGYTLYKLTDANNPFWDSTILAFSILGQFLIMKRKFENWVIWFTVDTIAIPLYLTKGLYLTALLYVFLLIIGLYGFYNWRKILHTPKELSYK